MIQIPAIVLVYMSVEYTPPARHFQDPAAGRRRARTLLFWRPVTKHLWKIFNYRSFCPNARLLGQIMQQAGIRVIPTVSWADSPTFEFCFDGIEPGGTISLSSVGIGKDTLQKKRYEAGFLAMIEKISPRTIIEYGDRHIDISDNIEHIFFQKYHIRVEKQTKQYKL